MSANYYISAIGMTGTNIDRFAVHTLDNSGKLSKPSYYTEEELIAKTKSSEQASFYTATWDYRNRKWIFSHEKVAPVTIEGTPNLRSAKDGIAKNNLSHLPVLTF